MTPGLHTPEKLPYFFTFILLSPLLSMSGLSIIMKTEEQKYTQSSSKHEQNILIANPGDILKHRGVPYG